jgi:excisionase family DNA binding protein
VAVSGPRVEDRLLVTLTVGELERLVEGCARTAVAEVVGQLVAPRFLTIAQVAEMLGICERYVGQLVREEGLPEARRLGRSPRYERDAVVAWMRAKPAAVTTLRRVR